MHIITTIIRPIERPFQFLFFASVPCACQNSRRRYLLKTSTITSVENRFTRIRLAYFSTKQFKDVITKWFHGHKGLSEQVSVFNFNVTSLPPTLWTSFKTQKSQKNNTNLLAMMFIVNDFHRFIAHIWCNPTPVWFSARIHLYTAAAA